MLHTVLAKAGGTVVLVVTSSKFKVCWGPHRRLGSELLFLELGCRYLLRSVSRVWPGLFVRLGRRLSWGRLYCQLLGQ